MGAMEFTLIRLFSGALMLAVLLALRRRPPLRPQTSWAGAAMLLLYALMFSLAYISLDTGFGALCLFAAVQLTILGLAAVKRSLSLIEALGAALAFAGFVWLVWPGLWAGDAATANRAGIAGMSLAGIGWGSYTVLGRSARDPLALTSGNFWRASLLALPLLIFILPAPAVTLSGAGLAIMSGAITSGIGYAIWYAALPKLTPALSGASQLLVPPLAALMGWAVLGEVLTARLAIATAIIFAGLIIVMLASHMRRA